MKIGLITTIDTNIGDDFIREGICHLLQEIFKGEAIEYVSINKHQPYSVYGPWHPVHLRQIADYLPVGANHVRSAIESLFVNIRSTCFDSCDLIVQCGAPVFWPNCSGNEWAGPLWHEVVGRLSSRIPVLNLAAGSCYPWGQQPRTLEPAADAEYVKAILGYCRLTTVRDTLAKSLCESVAGEAQLLPCSAFLAPNGRTAQSGEYVLINYMAGGGHDFGWELGIDPLQWETTVKQLIDLLRKRHKVAFLCHDQKEFSLSRSIAPDLPSFFPTTPAEYFDCVSKAKFAICNRMHASVAMAGMGIPSIAIGRDTRLLMVAQLGLPAHYVNDVSADLLHQETERMLDSLDSEKERLLTLQAETRQGYLSSISEALSRT